MRNLSLAIAALAFAAGSAQAALFSFASDRNTDGPTFSALASNTVSDGRTLDANGIISVDFLADRDDNGPIAAQSILARFEFSANITSYQPVPFAGQFIHNFTLSGGYNIIDDATNAVIFSATFSNALFSSW